MASKKVAVAQIGVGRWGANVARNIAKMRCARLVSVCDSNIRLAEMAAREWNARVESDIDRVLADKSVDAVVIATDHSVIDYGWVVENARLVIDTRNATRDVADSREKIIRA